MAKKQPAAPTIENLYRRRIKRLDSITAAPDTPDKERRRQYEAWLVGSRYATGNIVGGANPFAEQAREDARRLRNLTPKELDGEIARERQRLEELDAGIARSDSEERERTENAERGEIVKKGGAAGHEKVYGTAADKAARYQQYQTFVNDLHKQQPGEDQKWLLEKAAEHFHCHPSTIKRHTVNPKNK